jgi:hypothetical protein
VSLTLVEPEAVKSVAVEMLLERGVELMLYSMFAGVVMDGGVAFRAGVPCEKGDEHGGMQPPTLMFCLAGVDTEKLRHSLSHDPKTYRADFIAAEYFGQNHQFIVVGRCISTTHEALAAIRVMSTCMATGEAAGRAARIAVADGVSPSRINVRKLREELVARGAYLRS